MKKVKYYKNELIEYESFKLVDFYDPILRKPTVPWDLSDKEKTVKLTFGMIDVLEERGGLGLSANQVGLPWRICIFNMGSEIWSMFNPQIVESSLVPSTYQEGCLSYPGLYLKLDRAEWVKVKFQDMNGDWNEQRFDGLTAVCVQHELDHLDGIVYTDKVSPIKLDQAKRKVKKNLKNMRRISNEPVRQNTSKATKDEGPTISIINPPKAIEPVEKQPEKFVYTAG